LILYARKASMIIPIMTLLMYIALLSNIPLFRDAVIFIYLSFVPGFAILRLFKLNEISTLETFLLSIGLSIAFSMFMSLLVNELYIILDFSQPLSVIPLAVAISTFTMAIFFIDYKRNLSETRGLDIRLLGELKDSFSISIILILLPIISVLGFLYSNVFIILLSCAIIAVLCVMSVVSKRLVPETLFPFLILSISIALVCQVLLTSPHIVGFDANLEYYVFRLTQANGHWGFLNANTNLPVALNYNSMLSITLMPTVYSVLMQAQGDIVFKILYPFIFCLVPLTLFSTFEKQFGKLTGLLSTLFFVFTSTAFYGVEPLSLNRQIVGEFFLVLSVLLLISKTIPATKRRVLIIIFGAALIVSHYSLAFIYLSFVVILFIVSKLKPRIDDTINFVTVLLLFTFTLAWYTLGSNSLLAALTNTLKGLLDAGVVNNRLGTAINMYSAPEVFTVATWINLTMLIIPNLLLIIGILIITLRSRGTGIFTQYRAISIASAIILAISYFYPRVAVILNFTRVYAITLLFLAPCFVLGGQALLVTSKKTLTCIKRSLKLQSSSKNKNINPGFLLIALILSAYFLSQVGFVNQLNGGQIHTYAIDINRLKESNDTRILLSILYNNYIPQQDLNSAVWLLNFKVAAAKVFADYDSSVHVLTSYGLIPNNLQFLLTNRTITDHGSFIYLGTLNILNGVITTYNISTARTGSFKTSEISPLLENNDLIYSNGASEIWYSSQDG
jgi:uncharacterized membrane protein